jgi:hypothetical protein
MMIQLEMGPTFNQVIAELGALGDKVRKGASKGMKLGVKDAANHVSSGYLTGQALKSRTGFLRKAVDGWMADILEGVIGVRPGSAVEHYKWLLSDEERTITPKRAKFLTIPIGEGLTPSGVPRYASPRERPDGFFVNTGGRLLFGYKRGKRGKFRPLFVLVKSVLVQGSGALYDGVMDKVDDIAGSMANSIDEALGT